MSSLELKYLNQGIGLIMVDVVTTLSPNLHNELMHRMQLNSSSPDSLYAVAYQVSLSEPSALPDLSLWQEGLAIGAALPTLPLWLKGGVCIPIDLNTTYERTVIDDRLLE